MIAMMMVFWLPWFLKTVSCFAVNANCSVLPSHHRLIVSHCFCIRVKIRVSWNWKVCHLETGDWIWSLILNCDLSPDPSSLVFVVQATTVIITEKNDIFSNKITKKYQQPELISTLPYVSTLSGIFYPLGAADWSVGHKLSFSLAKTSLGHHSCI